MSTTPLIAHGFGGRLDLPVPTSFFMVGSGLVLVISFVALAVLWPRPRLQDGPCPRTMTRLPTALWQVGQIIGMLGLLLVLAAGFAAMLRGTDVPGARNIAPVLLWVGFWLVIPFMSAVFGNLYSAINPWRTMAGWVTDGDDERPELVDRWGVWPAAVMLFAFVWMELVWPRSGAPGTIAVAALLYTGYVLMLATRVGLETALATGDAFTPYNRLFSSIAPWGRDSQGRLVWRGWLRALPTLPQWPGLPAFVVIMIGTVSYDGLSHSRWWRDNLVGVGHPLATGTVGIVATTAAIGVGYYLACLVAARVGGAEHTASQVASRFAHTLVPIALAYAVAHSFTLIIFEGQQVWGAISDPFGLGWDLFGTADHTIDFFLGPEAIWYIMVGVIVGGHVLAVLLAHDRALADFPPRGAVRSQYAMLTLMVMLTGLGLALLST